MATVNCKVQLIDFIKNIYLEIDWLNKENERYSKITRCKKLKITMSKNISNKCQKISKNVLTSKKIFAILEKCCEKTAMIFEN